MLSLVDIDQLCTTKCIVHQLFLVYFIPLFVLFIGNFVLFILFVDFFRGEGGGGDM